MGGRSFLSRFVSFVKRFNITHLLVIAALLHIALSILLLTIGREQWLPSHFNSNGVGTFASDGYLYQIEVAQLADVLRSQGFLAWVTAPTQLHVRLYSFSYAIFSRWVGFNILTVEPLNLTYYLVIIWLVYQLGQSVFDNHAGIMAATIVALWPSFLLHTTQLLRDPLMILAMLVLVVSTVDLLTHPSSWQKILLLAVVISLSTLIIWITRLSAWEVVKAILYLGALGLLMQLWRDYRLWLTNIVAVLLVIVITSLFQIAPNLFKNQQFVPRKRANPVAAQLHGLPLWTKISKRRRSFAAAPTPDDNAVASNIDTNIEFTSPLDIILYLPRAFSIGFFAPFPNMWVGEGGQVGLAGRVLSGGEMVVTYAIELLALWGLWFNKNRLSSWFIFLIATLGIVGASLIVANIGTLYRVRYPFWMLIVVLGAGGASRMLFPATLIRVKSEDS